MNTFWGCETEKLTALAAVIGAGAARLHGVILAGAQSARAVAWSGPDGEEHRRRTEELVEAADAVVELLRGRSELLGEESAAQDVCSQPDGTSGTVEDPLGIRAVPPWHPAPGGGGPPRLGGIDLEDLGPLIGGPLAAEDPARLVELLPDLPDLPDPGVLGPMIGGPLAVEDPLGRAVPREDLPQGESFALDPEIVTKARGLREEAVGGVPIVGALQSAMGLHEGVDDVYDGVERVLEDNGLDALTPLVAFARTPNDVAGVLVGEGSVLGQVAGGVDRSVANVLQTGGEVSAALGDGDLAGAVGAGERGLYRNAGMTAEVLTATPLPALAETSSDLTGNAADLVEPFDAGAARTLRDQEQGLRSLGEGWEQGRRDLTDTERFHELRRSAIPMPWDPQG